jgi:hypothetical protein
MTQFYWKDNPLDKAMAMEIAPEGTMAYIEPSYYKIKTIHGKDLVFWWNDGWVRSTKTVKEVKHPRVLWMRNYTR